ncbi:hypothetical protein VTI28DRAFT_3089 [Corynascus sepedonium]
MVTLEQIRASNSKIGEILGPGLVAVFAGATSGIGEATLKQFAKHAVKPRIYFLGRSKASGDRLLTELQKINPEGEYHYISVDVSLIRSVDDVCREIKAKESSINLLFLSTGTLATKTETSEGLYYLTAVMYYARLRFIVNLLPQLQRAMGLRRVVSVLAGTKEGPVQTDDMQVRRMSVLRARGHAASLTTLALEEAAQRSAATISTSGAGPVSFVHAYPGFVRTPLGRKDVSGATATALVAVNAVLGILGPLIYIPIEESGERHVFLATSARFRAATGGGSSGDGTKEADGETISPSLPADGTVRAHRRRWSSSSRG